MFAKKVRTKRGHDCLAVAPLILLAIIVFVGILLRMPNLSDYPLDRDEFARSVPEFTFTSLIAPGSILLSRFFAALFKDPNWGFRYLDYVEWGTRLPAFLFGVANIITIYYLGKKFFGVLEGLLAAFIITFLMTHIGFSDINKEYGPLMFFATLSTLFAYKILVDKKGRKQNLLAYGLTSLTGIFFSSYFFLLVIGYQLVLLGGLAFLKNSRLISTLVRSLFSSQKRILIAAISTILFVLLAVFITTPLRSYFGIYFHWPTVQGLIHHFQMISIFVSQDNQYSWFLDKFVFLGLILFPFFPRYRQGFLYLILFSAQDFFLVNTIEFRHTAFILSYIRYHAFMLPIYVLAVVGAIGLLIALYKQMTFFLASKFLPKKAFFQKGIVIFNGLTVGLALFLFAYFNLKLAFPPLQWFYLVPEEAILLDYRDAGKYLNKNLKPGDTLVRVKNFGMDHKFNHINYYLNPAILSQVNYAIFPERTSQNNWYVPLYDGEEDFENFSDWLIIERFRPSFKSYKPFIFKLAYYGPRIRTRKRLNPGNWSVQTNITSNDDPRLTIDKNLNTLWGGAIKTGDFFTLDLKKEYLLNSINYNFNQYLPQNFSLWVSRDAVNWKPVFSAAVPGFYPHNISRIFFRPCQARYVKIEFLVDPLTIVKEIGIKEVEVYEIYEEELPINKEEIFISEPLKHFGFTNGFEGWVANSGIKNLRVVNGELRGQVAKPGGWLEVSFPDLLGKEKINYLNFALSVNQGQNASLGLKVGESLHWFKKIALFPDGPLTYYSINLDDYGFPPEAKDKIEGLVFVPSDQVGAEFRLDFLSLDKRNLPGVQVQDEESPIGFSQFIPYDPDQDYAFFQIGNRLNLEKGEYQLHFKIKVDAVDPDWKKSLRPPPLIRTNDYIESKDVSESDVLYVSLESTRGTFYESSAHLNVQGEIFKEANRYYDFSIRFKADGKEALFLQAFSPRHRRYPADLYITYPEIERIN